MLTQDDMQAKAQRLEIELRELAINVLQSGARGGLTYGMAKEVNAYLSAAIFAAQQAKMGLSPFIGLTDDDRAEAEEASHR
jgi:hypothetical protein